MMMLIKETSIEKDTYLDLIKKCLYAIHNEINVRRNALLAEHYLAAFRASNLSQEHQALVKLRDRIGAIDFETLDISKYITWEEM